MISRWRKNAMGRTSLLLGCMFCAIGPGCRKEQTVVETVTRLPRKMTFAVAPVLNFSGQMEIDPVAAADLLASELSFTPDATVIPVSRVVAVLNAEGKMQVESPRHAVSIAEAVGADAILVAGITEYDAYTPVVGLILQMYTTGPAKGPMLDAVAAARMGRPFEATRMTDVFTPAAQVQGTYNAMSQPVVDHVRKYAAERSENDHPQGWRQYLHVQTLYLRFCWNDAITNLMNQDTWKFALADPMETHNE
jgi:hypothetical protein